MPGLFSNIMSKAYKKRTFIKRYCHFNKLWIIFNQVKSLQHLYLKHKTFDLTNVSLNIFIVFVSMIPILN